MFPFYNNYPGTDLHEIDLAYILKLCAELRASNETLTGWKAQHEAEYELLNDKVEGLVNSLVDVITPWDSSIEYPIYSIVGYQDQNYIAIQPVPVGVMITNTEYWQPANTAMEQINAIGVNVANMRRHIYYTSITSIEDIIADTDETLMIVNGGNLVLDGVVFPSNIDIMFVNGIMSGSFTINGNIIAGRKQIFAVDANMTAKNDVGFPEWFGAVRNDATVDDTAAIQKCYDTFDITSFDSGEYHVNGTIYLDRSYTAVVGTHMNNLSGTSVSRGTRIIQEDGSANTFEVGVKNATTSSTYDIANIFIRDISIVVAADGIDYTANTYGVRIYVLRGLYMDSVSVTNYANGFYIASLAMGYISRCRFISNKPASVTEQTSGFHLDPVAPILGDSISSFSSIWIDHCDIHFNTPSVINTFGVYAPQGSTGIADIAIDYTNFYGCTNGIRLTGTTTDVQNDIFIRGNCVDNCFEAVVLIGALKAVVTDNWISVGRPYIGTGSAYTRKGVYVLNNGVYGSCQIKNNVIKAMSGLATAVISSGVRIENSRHIISENVIDNMSIPVEIVGTSDAHCMNIKIKDAITLNDQTHSANAAIRYTYCDNGIIEPLIKTSGGYQYGYGVIANNCTYVSINPSGIATDSILTAKVRADGTNFTNTNAFSVLANNNSINGAI